MKKKNLADNSKSFADVCENSFGRTVLYTNETVIDESNLLKDFNKRLSTHNQNAREADYLFNYYCGDQPILYRIKNIRPEINNQIVQNIAYYIVETKASDIAGEPIQYVLRGTEERKSQEIADLNDLMDAEDKPYYDISLARWRSICGTSYRYVGNDTHKQSLDESEFYLNVYDPRDTGVVYYTDDTTAYSFKKGQDAEGKNIYTLYTDTQWFKVSGNKIVEKGTNGFRGNPIIEYPNNENRLSDIEITISISDAINDMASNRQDGIAQFVQSFVKFVNCEMDAEKFKELRSQGAFIVKSNNGDNKADVDIMSSELNQSESQIAMDDLFNKLLIIQGLASRSSDAGLNTTKGAVELRNGHYDSEKRAELSEPSFKRAEKKFLRLILNRLRILKGSTLVLSDIEVKISRSKMDNMLTKAETLQMLLASGIYPERAIKSVGFFADPEQVAIESKARMDYLYPTEDKGEEVTNVSVEDGYGTQTTETTRTVLRADESAGGGTEETN